MRGAKSRAQSHKLHAFTMSCNRQAFIDGVQFRSNSISNNAFVPPAGCWTRRATKLCANSKQLTFEWSFKYLQSENNHWQDDVLPDLGSARMRRRVAVFFFRVCYSSGESGRVCAERRKRTQGPHSNWTTLVSLSNFFELYGQLGHRCEQPIGVTKLSPASRNSWPMCAAKCHLVGLTAIVSDNVVELWEKQRREKNSVVISFRFHVINLVICVSLVEYMKWNLALLRSRKMCLLHTRRRKI